MAILGAVDVGTNTFRYWVAEVDGNEEVRVRSLRSGRAIVRLGEGLARTGRLSEEAIWRAVHTLCAFRRDLEDLSIDRIAVVATSAVREASNRDAFVRRIRSEVGWELEVISGEQEASWTFMGMSLGLKETFDDAVLVDIGGGSTEMIHVREGIPCRSASLHMGVVRLTEQYPLLKAMEEGDGVRTSPTKIQAVEAMRREAERRIQDGLKDFVTTPRSELIGTAGTVTTLAAMDQALVPYDPERVNGYRLLRSGIDDWMTRLLPLSLEARRSIPGLEAGREDLIISGLVIVGTLMDLLKKNTLRVSEFGLREGVVYHLFRRMQQEAVKGP